MSAERPRPRRRLLVVGVAAAVSAGVVALMAGVPLAPGEPVASGAQAGEPAASDPVDTSARPAPPRLTDPRRSDQHLFEQRSLWWRATVTATLDRRAAAVLARDPAGYLATADASAAESYAAQGSAAANLARLPLAEYAYALDSVAPDPSLPGAYEVVARLRHRTVVEPEAVEVERRLTMIPAPAGWVVAADVPVGSPPLWEVGELAVAQTEHAVVVAVDGADPQRYVEDAERAALDVTAAWGTDWAQRILVVVPADASTIERVLGYTSDALGSIVALATSERSVGPTGQVSRIFVNPGPFGELSADGRRAILTHEAVHVATGSPGSTDVPLWFEEGFADAVGFAAVEIGPNRGAVDALQAVEAAGLPGSLPTDEDFAFTAPDVGAAYGLAWIACRSIESTYGLPALAAVYRAADAGSGTAEANLAAAFRDVLGITVDDVVAAWRADLTGLTGVT